MNVQFGISATADFDENTWTFIMFDGYKVKAGEFVIIEKGTYTKQHQLACDYIRSKFDASGPSQHYLRDLLIKDAEEAELSTEFINQLKKDNQL